ncbi:MAG: DUF1727 domain-containing protein [Oscillibacter sp.]|nr:DUF1727 domain-containing protein [Oscillibacter sp.]
MRKLLAILACKAGRFLGKLIGKGSSLPGKLALRICPDILARLELPPVILAVTGSNGKTSTVELIAAVLKGSGRRVIWNAEGSNQTEGVATLLLSRANLRGQVKADVLLIETDERYAARTFRFFRPTHFLITNLYRDQLTRNGHPEAVYDAILPAIAPETELILNADDPLSSTYGRGRENVKYFGLEQTSATPSEPSGVYHDGAFCPVCGGPMEYDFAHYNHIGGYRCPVCGHARPAPDYAGALDLDAGTLTLDGTFTLSLSFKSVYHGCNLLAAWAACREAGVEGADAARTMNDYSLKNGRMQTFRLGNHHGTLLTSKHENSIAYDTNLRYIAAQKEPCSVLVIVDAVSRKYFTSETSWLWDIDFDLLSNPQIARVVLAGRYCNDLAERLSYTAVPQNRVHVTEDIAAAAADLAASGSEDVFAVTCFSDRDKLLAHVKKEA